MNAFLPKNIYWSLFALLGVAYVIGLFVPLLDNDSAHHANIALHMYLTGDYVSLIDEGHDYLDKPHLLFWLAASSYHLFGVSSFAYKFPSLLFTIFGIYSTYRLGKSLYNEEVGKLSSLVIASAFAFILANNDVRMEAILTASIAFATWQLVDWVNKRAVINVIGAALGLALAFSTKGLIGVFVPAVGIFFYLLYKKEWKLFYHWQLLLMIVCFFVFISPVLYCYYLQYDLHPEKIIREKTGWSGVRFILWQQTFERYEGKSFGGAGSKDYFFFFHSFLWAFAPWSIIAYVAVVNRIRNAVTKKYEWLTSGTFLVMAALITFAGFKLPHYINIIFPATAVITSGYLLEKAGRPAAIHRLSITQVVICILCLVAAAIVNAWVFPLHNWLVLVGVFIFLILLVFILRSLQQQLQKLIVLSVLTSAFIFFLLNSNFYPQLLAYQAGNELAFGTRNKVDPKSVYIWPGIYNPSFQFYSKELKKDFADTVLNRNQPVWVLTDRNHLPELKEKGLTVLQQYVHYDYNIGTMTGKFINPNTRKQTLDSLFLIRVK
ncbi:MAG TPA: glycosyltransferase family 39 protein [Flavisolibacter sp.]|nr:glycosyltransferase family 39 protein [Flavisolibacter sp.]